MHDLNHDALEALKAAPETLTALLKGVSQSQAQSAQGGDENWSVVEVVCHLRDAEEYFLKRIEAMRDQADPVITGYDQAALAHERNYTAENLQKALAGFMAYRKRVVDVFSKLSPEQWQRTGQHSEIGQISIFSLAVHHAAHDAIHFAQIARQLNAG